MNVYVASSWRNIFHQNVVAELRGEYGFEVYDFRNPAPGNNGFAWADCDPEAGLLQRGNVSLDHVPLSIARYLKMLNHPLAETGFALDMSALMAADAVLLVQPCGRSAHLELGWAAGVGKWTGVLMLEEIEPELMVKMCSWVGTSLNKAVDSMWKHFDS